MENNSQKPGGGFINGFLFGLFFGGLIVFLLATKKGKKILKAISEEGLDKVSGIIEKAENAAGLEEVYEEEEETAPKKKVVIRGVYDKPKTKRFFRGISRRLN